MSADLVLDFGGLRTTIAAPLREIAADPERYFLPALWALISAAEGRDEAVIEGLGVRP